MENHPSKLDKAVKVSIVAGALIVALSAAYYLVLFLPKKEVMKLDQQSQTQKPVSEPELKKQALVDFDKKVSSAIENSDFVALYDFSQQSIKENYTKEKFVDYKKDQLEKNKIAFYKVNVDGVEVNGNNGTVDKTFIACFTQAESLNQTIQWAKNNPTDEKAKQFLDAVNSGKIDAENLDETAEPICKDGTSLAMKMNYTKFVFGNGQWQLNDVNPSERALKASSYFYNASSSKQKKAFVEDFGEGSDKYLYAIHNFANFLDTKQERLVDLETNIEKDKINKSRPVVNYEMPDITLPSPQQYTAPRHCTSNSIGDFTYTNCY